MEKKWNEQADGWRDEEMDVYDPKDLPERRKVIEDKRFTITNSNTSEVGYKVGGIRAFDTGATRDTNTNKLDYYRFNNALVDKVYAEYMHKHRKQSDGSLRSGDNWQNGWDKHTSMESMTRHVQDIKLHLTGYQKEATENLVDSICATIFNAKALLLEVLKESGRAHR